MNSWKTRQSFDGNVTIDPDTSAVSVSGFSFKDNWCGNETIDGQARFHDGKKIIIEFTVKPKAGFLGGNDVYTNTSAGIYENDSAATPIKEFEKPTVNVPIKPVTVDAKDKNVYLKGSVTTDQLKSDATVKVGDVSLDLTKDNYGLADWQTEYVNITVTITDKDGKTFNADDLTGLTEDKDFTVTVTVTVSPKTAGTTTPEKGNAATAKSGTDTKKINVFKPVLTFKDSTAYYGETVPTNNDFGGNKVSKVWKHDTTESTTVTMLGDKPALDITYTPDNSKIFDGKHIGGTAEIPDFTPGEGWVKYGDYYYYTQPVAPNAKPATNLISSITLTGSYTDADGGMQAIDVMAEAIQSVPADAVKAAWGAGFGINADGSLAVPTV